MFLLTASFVLLHFAYIYRLFLTLCVSHHIPKAPHHTMCARHFLCYLLSRFCLHHVQIACVATLGRKAMGNLHDAEIFSLRVLQLCCLTYTQARVTKHSE